MNIQMESAIVGAAVTGILAFIGIGIELWLSQRAQKKYYVDTHVISMLENCEERITELEKIEMQLIKREGAFAERTEMALKMGRIVTNIETELLMTYMVKNPKIDFHTEISKDAQYFIVPKPQDASKEAIEEGRSRIQRLSRNISSLHLIISGAKLLKIDELSGHKNRNKITKWKRTRKWFKEHFLYSTKVNGGK